MNFQFTPTDNLNDATLKVPCLEDARASFAPYYTTEKSLDRLQAEVLGEIAKLGGGATIFREGFFGENPKRYGYVISFQLGGHLAQIVCAGLPLRTESPKKIIQVRAQALSIMRDWLKAAVTARVFSPGANPLLQFLLVDGKRTLAEALLEDGRLLLPSQVEVQS